MDNSVVILCTCITHGPEYPWGTESTALNDSQPTKLSERVLNVSGPGSLWDPEVQYRVPPIDLICRQSIVNTAPLLRIFICNNYLFIRCTCIRKILIFQILETPPMYAHHAHRRMNVEQ